MVPICAFSELGLNGGICRHKQVCPSARACCLVVTSDCSDVRLYIESHNQANA